MANRESDRPGIGIIEGRYAVVAKIGRGGMGEVFRADDAKTRRTVAIKILRLAHAPDSRAAQRFLREAQAAGSVNHPNVVRILDFGKLDDERPYMVMEYLEGETLAERLRVLGALALDEAFAIATQVLEGLAAAHAVNVVHRDLKPANVFLALRGGGGWQAKIVDFGLSKWFGGGLATAPLTAPGSVVGTPLYLAPEQARAEPELDHRVDLWAAGVMLYQMLAGTPPFRADTYQELVAKILRDEPAPPSTLRPALPAAVDEFVARALRRERDARFQSAREMARVLGEVAARMRVVSVDTFRHPHAELDVTEPELHVDAPSSGSTERYRIDDDTTRERKR